MKRMEKYWLMIEPYVYINIAEEGLLLYNTLDGVAIESKESEIMALVRELLCEENVGVIGLEASTLNRPDVQIFVREMREKYMGDVIDQNLLKVKPVQVLPVINYPQWRDMGCEFRLLEDWSTMLLEVTAHLDRSTDLVRLVAYLQVLPENTAIVLEGDPSILSDGPLWEGIVRRSAPKTIACSYDHCSSLTKNNFKGFSYQITVHFPVDLGCWEAAVQWGRSLGDLVSYRFEVASEADCQAAVGLAEDAAIEKIQLVPVYTGNNLDFFRKNVFLTHEDILATRLTMRDFFRRRAINENDFGKLHILPNGDIYANRHYPALGNTATHDFLTIIQKEIKEGCSWLRVRNQEPCTNCLYRDLCPSPSDYELEIGCPNLCYINH